MGVNGTSCIWWIRSLLDFIRFQILYSCLHEIESDRLLNFFLTIHRSIFDLQFYKEAKIFKKGSIFVFFLKQVIFTALIASSAQVYYLTDPQRGIVENVVKVFEGMEIKNGILHSSREVPLFPSSSNVIPILEQFAGFPLFLGSTEDSLFIIDTSSHINYSIRPPVFLLRADRLEIIVNEKWIMNAPYTKLLPSAESIIFSKQFISEYIRKYSLFFLMQLFLPNMFMFLMLLTFSIIFLSMAAFFFRVDRSRSFKQHLRMAIFAVTPITVGTILAAVSGVKLSWTWHVLIFLSTIVMFRAMLISGGVTPGNSGDDNDFKS